MLIYLINQPALGSDISNLRNLLISSTRAKPRRCLFLEMSHHEEVYRVHSLF
jgi:hypothetical protein